MPSEITTTETIQEKIIKAATDCLPGNDGMPSESKMDEIILATDDGAAKQVTITGWVSRKGHFYGDDERLARWDGATHNVCECGEITPKHYTACAKCREKAERERYLRLPECEVGDAMVCVDDQFWPSLDECCEPLIDDGIDPLECNILICEPNHVPVFDPVEFLADVLPEDEYDIPAEIKAAAKVLNDALREHGHRLSWWAADKRPRRDEIAELCPTAAALLQSGGE